MDDYAELAAYAAGQGVAIGTVNANVFQDDDYRLGSVCNPDPQVRRKALAALLECVDIMDATGSQDLKLWFADGTNYPGQDSITARQDRLAEALDGVYQRLSGGQRLILEYKLFEPAFYTTDVPDWGTAYLHCVRLGERAKVCVDTGHHAPGTNIEFIVAMLLRAGKLGAFDFNSRFYADDDLMVGAADPFQLFRILHEVHAAGAFDPAAGIAFMLDQCHNIEPKIPAQIRSVLNVQEATAKVLLVDTGALAAAQQAGDVLGANAVAPAHVASHVEMKDPSQHGAQLGALHHHVDHAVLVQILGGLEPFGQFRARSARSPVYRRNRSAHRVRRSGYRPAWRSSRSRRPSSDPSAPR